jgi:hypothetical protein
MHVEASFVRKLGDLIRVRRGTPDRRELRKEKSRAEGDQRLCRASSNGAMIELIASSSAGWLSLAPRIAKAASSIDDVRTPRRAQ